MASLENLQNRKIIGITDGEVAMPVVYNENIQDSKYFYNCNVISLAATIARTIDKDRLFRGIFYDTSIKRPHSSTKAAEIFAIGKALFNDTTQYGIWKISAANVHQNDLVNVGWELVKRAPDKFIDAAIAFDGTWELTEDFKYYSLFTEETPWAFYVTNNNILYYWNYRTNTVQQLDTNVMYCAAERGYSPKDYAELNSDQGIVVVYATKNQEVKYFTYSVTSGTEFKQWLGPETITTFTNETIKSVQVHRLNDYRVGILITTDKKSYWYITDRVYSQMAFRPEKFNLVSSKIAPFIHISMRRDGIAETIQPTFTWEISENKDVVTITSNARILIEGDYDISKAISGTVNMPPIRDIEVTDYTITVYFERPAQATFTITLNPNNIRVSAYVPDILDGQGGGWVTITSKSHEFEIYLAHNYSEAFNLVSSQIKNVGVQIHQIYTEEESYSESFNLVSSVIKNIGIEIKDSRETLSITNEEKFNLVSSQIKNIAITVEGINVEPI